MTYHFHTCHLCGHSRVKCVSKAETREGVSMKKAHKHPCSKCGQPRIRCTATLDVATGICAAESDVKTRLCEDCADDVVSAIRGGRTK